MENNALPISKKMCSTCPWRKGSPMGHLRKFLEESSLKTSRICHSTSKIIVAEATRVSDSPLICRGSRNYQLRFFVSIGFLAKPTDQAWENKVQELNQKKNNNNESQGTQR